MCVCVFQSAINLVVSVNIFSRESSPVVLEFNQYTITSEISTPSIN